MSQHHVIFLAVSAIKGGIICPNHTASGLKRSPHRLNQLDPNHSSPSQWGSLSVGILMKFLWFIQYLNDTVRSHASRGLQDKQWVLNNDLCVSMKVSGAPAVVTTDSGSDCKERSERSSIFCITCYGGAMVGVIHFITDGRFSAAMARCSLLGQDI